ncbi:MAG: thiamine diphosphokinase [Acidimicrobiales bacterium]
MPAPSASDTIIVVTGGDTIDPAELGRVPERALVIAADSGVELAQALGLPIHLAIGDFDSVDPGALRVAEAAGALVERHPVAKDATDLELALDAALARRPRRVHVIGGHGGRLDHLLANALLLAAPAYAGVELVAHMGPARVTVVRAEATLLGHPGDLVTLLAVHGPACGVATEGLLYPLDGEHLQPGSTRGVSNEMTATHAVVRLDSGVLLAVQPGQAGTHHLERTSP